MGEGEKVIVDYQNVWLRENQVICILLVDRSSKTFNAHGEPCRIVRGKLVELLESLH